MNHEPGVERTVGRGRVLFADDEQSVLLPTSKVLKNEGFSVVTAECGEEFATALTSSPFDVVLLDIEMPGNRDLELLGLVSSERPLTPVVILTGRPSIATAIRSVRLGVVDYLTKPPQIEELLQCLDRGVYRARLLRSLDEAEQSAKALSAHLANLKSVIRDGPVGPSLQGSSNALGNLGADELASLSPRERQVVLELSRGANTQEVAKALGLSPNTVRNHLKSVFVKLRVKSQVALLGKLAGARSA